VDKYLLKPAEVAALLNVSERYVYVLIEQGDLRTVTLANRQMIFSDELKAFVEKLRADRDATATAGGVA
jgi:excisionase family DNA binding protein